MLGLDCDAPLTATIPVQYRFVLRYLSPHDNALSKEEVATYTSRGLGTGALCEHSVTDIAGGAASGTANARQWLASASELGMPSGSVLILACDEDPTAVVITQAIAYYRAAAAQIRAAHHLIGAYGGHDLMVSLAHEVDVLMQAAGWSGGKGNAPGIDIAQQLQQVTVGGVACDVDVAYSTNFGLFDAHGLWPHPTPTPSPVPSPVEEEVKITDVAVSCDASGHGTVQRPESFSKVASWSAHGGEGRTISVECQQTANGGTQVSVNGAGPAQIVIIRLGLIP